MNARVIAEVGAAAALVTYFTTEGEEQSKRYRKAAIAAAVAIAVTFAIRRFFK